MSSDAVLFFQSIPKMLWSLMNSFNIPGLGFTPGALIMGVISFDIIIWVVGNIFSFGANHSSAVSQHFNRVERDAAWMERTKSFRGRMGDHR